MEAAHAPLIFREPALDFFFGELAGLGQLRVRHWKDPEQEAQQLLLLSGGQFHRRLLNVH